MKKIYLCLLLGIALLSASAQTYTVQWGEETKLKKGSIDFDIINADESGVYLVEGKMRMKSYFVIGATYGTDHRLIKFDKSYNDVFTQDYRHELKGLSYKGIQFLKKDMYLFADDYIKREKRYVVYGTKIDRNTGLASGDMKELASFQLDSKKDDFEYSLVPNSDSTQWLLIGDVSSEDNVAISVTVLDKQLKVKGTTPIQFSFSPKSFTLEDVLLTKDNKFLVVGRQYDQVPVGKRNKTRRTFTKYVFSKYNSKGQKELDFPTDIGDHFAMNGKAIQLPDGGLSFAGFYSDNRKKSEVNGVFVYKMDVVNGGVLQSSFKELSEGMLDQAVEDEADMDNDLKKEKKEREKAKENEDDDGLSKNFVIRGVEYNPANGSLLLIAELSKFEQYTVMNSSYNSVTKSYSNSWTTYYRYTNSDLMVINTNSMGEIEWVNTLPKKQVETIQSGRSGGPGISFYSDPTSLFARGGGMPFYSSFSYMLRDHKLIFLLNDHAQNGHVQKLGDKAKVVYNFRKSVAYAVSMDLNSGLFTRKLLLSNEDDPVLMPRLGFVVGKEFFLPAMKMKTFGKTEFKMGKVTVKGGEM
jgi:hypothetical protein